jgi:hypothetical protein
MDSPEYMEKLSQLFATIQAPMREGAKLEKSLEGKDPNEVKISRFNRGNLEQGQQVFDQISKSISGSHSDFYFKEQKVQQFSSNQNNSLIEKVRQNPHD